MNKLITIALILLLCGCDDRYHAYQDEVIKETKTAYMHRNIAYCTYGIDAWYFTDTCGKFNVGDTIKIVKK